MRAQTMEVTNNPKSGYLEIWVDWRFGKRRLLVCTTGAVGPDAPCFCYNRFCCALLPCRLVSLQLSQIELFCKRSGIQPHPHLNPTFATQVKPIT